MVKTLLVGLRAAAYMTGSRLFFAWLAFRVRALDRVLQVTFPYGVEIPAIVMMVAGGVLGLTCAGTFIVRGRGTPAPFDAPTEFVAIGPHRYVRNPMYVGGLFLLAGFGLYECGTAILAVCFDRSTGENARATNQAGSTSATHPALTVEHNVHSLPGRPGPSAPLPVL